MSVFCYEILEHLCFLCSSNGFLAALLVWLGCFVLFFKFTAYSESCCSFNLFLDLLFPAVITLCLELQ